MSLKLYSFNFQRLIPQPTDRPFDSLGNVELALIIQANKIVFSGEITPNGTGVPSSRPIQRSTPIVQRVPRIACQPPDSSAILTYQTIPDHRRYIPLFLQTAIDLPQQKNALRSNFIFSDYYIFHHGLPGIGPLGGDIDFIIASTQGHVPPTQGLRARCIPDEIRFFVTLPRLGHTGEWTKAMAVMLAQLLAVCELNGFPLLLFWI